MLLKKQYIHMEEIAVSVKFGLGLLTIHKEGVVCAILIEDILEVLEESARKKRKSMNSKLI